MTEEPHFIQSPEAARRVALPSRAFFGSWRDQTLPARHAALAESERYFEQVAESTDATLRDMALAAVIADAVQPLEDLAHLGRAWDEPFGGLAHYLRATAYSHRTATNFWGSIANWDDERIKVFSGLYGRDPATGEPGSMIPAEIKTQMSAEQWAVIAVAEEATVRRLRILLSGLGQDWRQFSPYYNAFKHGGLVVNREDICWVGDEVEEVTEETPTHDPSLAIWHPHKGEMAGKGDFNLTRLQVADAATHSGRLALDLIERFIESRSAIFEAVDFAPDGSVQQMRELTLPWTVWLAEGDLTEDQWKRLGRGPRIMWGKERPAIKHEPS
jgi:hypothetical protein